jgi:putative GTP pyrophosphokinase
MKGHTELSPKELQERSIRFFNRYGQELDQIRELLNIRLSQLSLAYTIENKLPPEAIKISTRVKTLNSFLKKLARKEWPQFYYPTEVVQDLIGARVTCWFIDDCHGFLKLINSSHHLKSIDPIDDYITNPKRSGYRALHVLANVSFDSVQRQNKSVVINAEDMLCEIQIRTKLQDAWGDITHEFHYKAKNHGVDNEDYEVFLADIAERLSLEDKTLIKFRDVYQKMADKKLLDEKREGFRDE